MWSLVFIGWGFEVGLIIKTIIPVRASACTLFVFVFVFVFVLLTKLIRDVTRLMSSLGGY
ncbi:hypothetical protein [Vibrio splendidus]|uniref:hypothetical protein n=1 Tax=Vibrio splendidus TaxID=29497 RepID=UPI000F68A212|nr:hypothetical protein [Vibrio splendidus]